ncbi:DUF397 domain-containing protein [Dactylosporangium sp. NPDC048998]|uniref:DUF397 domain-containing protein n=1 Tax=Dactylosporangium sp. NPDC048998 TaxID=3363976 RepID=UPI00372378F5
MVNVDGVRWRRSSRCSMDGGDCVEVAVTGGRVLVRDSTQPDGAVLAFDAGAWSQFLEAVVGSDDRLARNGRG